MRGLSRTSAVVGVVGLVLLIFQSVQAMRGVVIGTVGTTILFVGLGLIVVAAVLLVLAVTTELPADSPADAATESVVG